MLREQEREIQRWLICALEYLTDSLKLFKVYQIEELERVSRPNLLLIGYFLENILKSCIMKIENKKENECFKHLSMELIKKAGISISNIKEIETINYLKEVIIWGKYPKKGIGNEGEMIIDLTEEKLDIFANETVFLTKKANLKVLILLNIDICEQAFQIIISQMEKDLIIYFREPFKRINQILNEMLRMCENQ
ncbi:hypothetical protein [Leptospira kanakyensis]|uniref:Uncharacterized protein n=1 Tax=Leptospira kanakyensis TaxID=2484968 RepID=A0A6N4QLR8_9LEPT|nr:hypothetical protein [Leptospira kanakyensis]TGK76976.1 hypothetical protein EHQ18_00085 [Leptospira kanakyensis]